METRGDIKFYRNGVQSSLSEDLDELEANKVSFDALNDAPEGSGALDNYYTKSQTDTLISNATTPLQNQISVNRQDIVSNTQATNANTQNITTINSKIPAQASALNQLADKDFVNSSINAVAAFYLTYDAQGNPFPTKTALNSAVTFYCAGQVRVPTKNDYCLVLSDESKGTVISGYTSFATTTDYVGYYVIYNNAGVEVTSSNKNSVGIVPGMTVAYQNLPTTRYVYSVVTVNDQEVGQWDFQYVLNSTSFTAAQVAAINSGITSALVGQITTNQNNITTLTSDKADKNNKNQSITAGSLAVTTSTVGAGIILQAVDTLGGQVFVDGGNLTVHITDSSGIVQFLSNISVNGGTISYSNGTFTI